MPFALLEEGLYEGKTAASKKSLLLPPSDPRIPSLPLCPSVPLLSSLLALRVTLLLTTYPEM